MHPVSAVHTTVVFGRNVRIMFCPVVLEVRGGGRLSSKFLYSATSVSSIFLTHVSRVRIMEERGAFSHGSSTLVSSQHREQTRLLSLPHPQATPSSLLSLVRAGVAARALVLLPELPFAAGNEHPWQQQHLGGLPPVSRAAFCAKLAPCAKLAR